MRDREAERRRREASSMYLADVVSARDAVESLTAEIESLRQLASGVHGVDYARDGGSGASTDAMPEAVSRILDLVEARSDAVRRYSAVLDDCDRRLSMLGGRYAAILRMHHLSGKTLTEIGRMGRYMHDADYMSRLHGYPLIEFSEHIPKSYLGGLPKASFTDEDGGPVVRTVQTNTGASVI